MTVMFRRDPAVTAGSITPASSWLCARCGTDNQAHVPEGCPWCADCRSVIALDPGYLRQYGRAEAQRLLDAWVNTRPAGRKPRRVLATA